MKKIKFADLLKYDNKVHELFGKYDLTLNKSSRICQYFNSLKEIEEARLHNVEEFHKLFDRDKAKRYFCLFYVHELHDLIDALDQTNQDPLIVKNKLMDLEKGTYLLSEESTTDTSARNTSFELGLFAFLHKIGTKVTLSDPNPDLRVITNNFSYNIECKRPASIMTVKNNLKKALKQLRKPSLKAGIPTIALSLDKVLLNDDLIFHSQNGQAALLGLEKILFSFALDNKLMLDRIFGSEPCVVLYYLSCLSGFEDKTLPMANATFMIGNVYNFESNLQHKIYDDLMYFQLPIEK